MLTTRARWILILAAAAAVVGVAAGYRGTAQVGTALLLWLLAQWLLFRWRCDVLAHRLVAARQVADDSGPMRTLWIGRTYRVRVQVRLPSWFGLPYVHVQERWPQALG